MTSPERIQLSRKQGWRLPPNTVKVDRTTKWGNPFVPGRPNDILNGQRVVDNRHAFVLYRAFATLNERLVAAAQNELVGKNLACWCVRLPYEDVCHAAVLIEIANHPAASRLPAVAPQVAPAIAAASTALGSLET